MNMIIKLRNSEQGPKRKEQSSTSPLSRSSSRLRRPFAAAEGGPEGATFGHGLGAAASPPFWSVFEAFQAFAKV